MKNDKKNTDNETKIYLTPDSTLQTPEEKAHDASIDPRKDDTISVSRDDPQDDELTNSERNTKD
ncbi:MAG: hypothetical protein H0U44_00715 [Flavisolibacter sp.]|jgi:hypothetical protein|nr:hypothetical protein [Flavisolibacter sp.]